MEKPWKTDGFPDKKHELPRDLIQNNADDKPTAAIPLPPPANTPAQTQKRVSEHQFTTGNRCLNYVYHILFTH